MKALIYDGPEVLNYRDAPTPVAGEGEALIEIQAVGICGSDMHAFLGHDDRRPAPLILGHEAAGIVRGGPRDGEHVTINPLVTCGECRDCKRGRDNLCPKRQIISMPPREGAFAEWITMPLGNLVTVPDHVGFAEASLAEPIACGWHAVRLGRAACDLADTDTQALVYGGGAIGVGAALSLVAQGVSDVTLIEPNTVRREFAAQKLGAGITVLDAAPEGQMFDLIIDGVGYTATRASATAVARPGGVIAHIGLGQADGGLDIRRMTLQEITFIGTYTYTAQDFRDTAQAMFDGKLGALDWTEHRALADGAQAFDDIRAGRVAAPKIILIPAQQEH